MGRPLEDAEIQRLVIDLLKNPSERDQQKLIGPSEIGNPCLYCLANRLMQTPKATSRYWLGARIGTAIHEALQEQGEKYKDGTDDYHFAALEDALLEQKFPLGTLDGYGTINLKPDLVLTKHNHLVDYKTSTQKKIPYYKLNGVPYQYVIQQQLYAWGLNKNGIKVERISLAFINRDGQGDGDFWVHSFNYDETVAVEAWYRLENVWKWLQQGGNVDDLASDENCFYCNQILRR